MTLDVSLGNISEADARKLGATDDHEPGQTEPWVTNLICAFARAIGAVRVLETGAFRGDTTVALADAIGEGWLIAAELDQDRAYAVRDRLKANHRPGLIWRVEQKDALEVIRDLPENYLDLAFVDDSHEKEHVAEETDLLWTRTRPGGLLLYHDVFGVCDLQAVVKKYGGYSIDLPRMGPAGGLGIVQVTP